MINNGFDHFKYSVHIRFIRNTANPYSVYKKPNPNTANPYSAYKKTNPNSFISYSVYKKRNYSVPYIFGFGRIIRIRLIPFDFARFYVGDINLRPLTAFYVSRQNIL